MQTFIKKLLLSAVVLMPVLLSSENNSPSDTAEKSWYLELGPCAECNYCHIIRDNLFPIFVALAQVNHHRTYKDNRLYSNKTPFKREIFNVVSDYPIQSRSYNPTTMQKLSFGFPLEKKDVYTQYFPLFLAQLHERFGINSPAAHKTTITLVQRLGSRRVIVNISDLQRALQNYCDAHNYVLNIVNLESAKFKEQLQLMADTDIFIACHGAALTNAPFIRKKGIVIEIFPYNFNYTFLRMFATNSRPDITYYSWHLPQHKCTPTTVKSFRKELEFRYWRDQNVTIDPRSLIEIIEHLRRDIH
jgi:capsular polysaccharide biosynthesis protein